WWEIPNLRAKSFGCLSDTIKKIFGAKVPRLEQMSLRERRRCLIYGLVGGIGSFWLLGWALARASGNVIHAASPFAFVVSAAFIGGSARALWRSVFRKPAAKSPRPAASSDTTATARVEDPPAPARSSVSESPEVPVGTRPSD